MNKNLPVVLLAACAAVLAFGIAQIFQLRFAAGDVYPAYSSLRADPLGTMALYEALDQLPGVSVDRDFSDRNELPAGPATTYLHLAAKSSEWRWLQDDLLAEMERFARRGGRFVVTFYPEAVSPYQPSFHKDRVGPRPSNREDGDGRDSEDSEDDRPKSTKERDAAARQKRADAKRYAGSQSLKTAWGLDFTVVNLTHDNKGIYKPSKATNCSNLPLPDSLEWHSGVVFTNLGPAWKAVYKRDENPVVIERVFGAGSVVIATDAYFTSNEAIFADRHPDLLAWIIGPSSKVIFDEAHLGVVENSNISGLIKRYRLRGFIGALAVVTGLFVWKNATRLGPVKTSEHRSEWIEGRDAEAGFVQLLRRNIPANRILQTCFEEWKKSTKSAPLRATNNVSADEAFRAAAQDKDPAAAYNIFCQSVRHAKRRREAPLSKQQS